MNKHKRFWKYLLVIILVTVLSLAFAFLGLFYLFKYFNYSKLTIVGIAKEEVLSNKVVWSISNVYEFDYPGDYEYGYDISTTTLDAFMEKQDAYIKKHQDDFKKYLMENDISENDIEIGKVDVSGFDEPPFVFRSVITVSSNDVYLVEDTMDKVSRARDFKANFYTKSKKYYYNLDEVTRNELVERAIKAARINAERDYNMQGRDIIGIESVLPPVVNIIPADDISAISLFEKSTSHFTQADDDIARDKMILVSVRVMFKVASKDGSSVIPNTSSLISTQDIKFVPVTADDHVKGSSNAPITIIEYGDTSCSPCKNTFNTMNKIMEKFGGDGRMKWVYRQMLAHKSSELEARGTECAAKLGGNEIFWSYLGMVYDKASANRGLVDVKNSDNNLNDGLSKEQLNDIASELRLPVKEFDKCISSDENIRYKVQNESYLASKNGINGIPNFIITLSKPLDETAFQALSDFNISQYQYMIQDAVLISPDRMTIKIDIILDYYGMEHIFDIISNSK